MLAYLQSLYYNTLVNKNKFQLIFGHFHYMINGENVVES